MIRHFAVPAAAVALVLALGACATPSTPAPAAAAPVPADTLGRIKAVKAINVAFAGDSLPFSFVGPDNQPAGYSIDLCKHVIAAIGRAAGEPNLAVRWKVGTTAERLAMVGDGRADLECGNTTPTLSRMKSVDFSNLVFVDASGFLVRGDARIGRAAELGGKRIAVIAGTTNEASLERALKQHSIAAQVVKVREAGEAVALLESGGADAFRRRQAEARRCRGAGARPQGVRAASGRSLVRALCVRAAAQRHGDARRRQRRARRGLPRP